MNATWRPPHAPDPVAIGRGLLLALLVVGLSALGHGLAGGALDPLTVAVLLVVAAMGSTLLTTLAPRAWSLPRLLAVLAASQVVIHFALQDRWLPGLAHGVHGASPDLTGAGAGSAVPMAPGMAMDAMAGPGSAGGAAAAPTGFEALRASLLGTDHLVAPTGPGLSAPGLSAPGLSAPLEPGALVLPPAGGLESLDLPMLVGHAVAVLLAAVLVWRGEAAAAVLVALLATALHPVPRLTSALPCLLRGAAVVDWSPQGGRTALVAYSLRRRGPPELAVR